MNLFHLDSKLWEDESCKFSFIQTLLIQFGSYHFLLHGLPLPLSAFSLFLLHRTGEGRGGETECKQ